MKPITRTDAEKISWETLQAIPVPITETREAKPQANIFSSIQEIRDTQQKRGELK
jgi:hypothetical protein